MIQTSARLLRLLSLLQTSRDWSGDELARRLEVHVRTVRIEPPELVDRVAAMAARLRRAVAR